MAEIGGLLLLKNEIHSAHHLSMKFRLSSFWIAERAHYLPTFVYHKQPAEKEMYVKIYFYVDRKCNA